MLRFSSNIPVEIIGDRKQVLCGVMQPKNARTYNNKPICEPLKKKKKNVSGVFTTLFRRYLVLYFIMDITYDTSAARKRVAVKL